MGEVDKPFGCPQPGCGMSFTNEDHLTVHRRRHEMQLSTNAEHLTPSLVKHHGGFIIDQTPTPTRFLRQCDEVGLFQEITLNPFDEQFRRASLLRSHHSITESINGNESLDTPRVLPPLPEDSDHTISSTTSTSREDLCSVTTSSSSSSSFTSTQQHLSYLPTVTYLSSSCCSSSSSSSSTTTTTTTTICPPHSITSIRVFDREEEEEEEEDGNSCDAMECVEREGVEGERERDVTSRLSLNVAAAAAVAGDRERASAAGGGGSQPGSVISTPTPVITAGPSVTQSLGAVEIGSVVTGRSSPFKVGGSVPVPLTVPTIGVSVPSQSSLCAGPSPVHGNAHVASTTSSSSSIMPPASPSATVLQLLLRLPNGQAIPVEIPATPVVSSSPQSTTTTTTTTTASPTTTTTTSTSALNASSPFPNLLAAASASSPHSLQEKSPQQSLAKMKLKQVLTSSSTAARPGSSGSRASRANTADRIAEMTRSRNISGASSTEGDCDEEGVAISCVDSVATKGERKRRHSSENENPVEKRKKFLERNRAAAIRCREKKKKWIENLSIKYDELGSINTKLQSEVSSLRSEVAALKSMLLQHKDCPVTLAMQGDGSFDGMNGGCAPFSLTIPEPPLPPSLPQPPPPQQQPQPILPPAPLPLPPPHSAFHHKPRTRSLSLPSIPSTSNSISESRGRAGVVESSLPVNLSCVYEADVGSNNTTTIVTSASSSSSSSTSSPPSKITIGHPINNSTTSHHHQVLTNSTSLTTTTPTTTTNTTLACLDPQLGGNIIRISPGPSSSSSSGSARRQYRDVSSPHHQEKSQILTPAALVTSPSPLTPSPHTGKMGKIYLGPPPPDHLGTETALVVTGMPNVIMTATAAQLDTKIITTASPTPTRAQAPPHNQTQPQPQLLNLTLSTPTPPPPTHTRPCKGSSAN